MQPSTLEIIRACLAADATIQPAERARLLNSLKAPAPSRPAEQDGLKVWSRRELAKRLGRSLRYVDKLAQVGVIQRVLMPGRVRGIGFQASQVEALFGA
jgi:hypothetical protein